MIIKCNTVVEKIPYKGPDKSTKLTGVLKPSIEYDPCDYCPSPALGRLVGLGDANKCLRLLQAEKDMNS